MSAIALTKLVHYTPSSSSTPLVSSVSCMAPHWIRRLERVLARLSWWGFPLIPWASVLFRMPCIPLVDFNYHWPLRILTSHAAIMRQNMRGAKAVETVTSSRRFRKCSQPEYCVELYKSSAGRSRFCPIESCSRRYTDPKALYKHYRQENDALHKELLT